MTHKSWLVCLCKCILFIGKIGPSGGNLSIVYNVNADISATRRSYSVLQYEYGRIFYRFYHIPCSNILCSLRKWVSWYLPDDCFYCTKEPIYMNEEDNRFLCTPCLTLIGWPFSYLCASPSPRQLATLRDSISHSISIHLIMLLSTYLSLSLYNHQFFLGKTLSQ